MKKILLVSLIIPILLLPFLGCSKKEAGRIQESQKIEYYTCSMHPFIHMDKPGRCPICGMELVPVYAEASQHPTHSESLPSLPPDSKPANPSSQPGPQGKKEKKILYWVDSMHPWYKSDKPGKAPDCGMDLTPVYEEETTVTGSSSSQVPNMGTVHLSPEKEQLIGVRTEAAEVRPLNREITAAGRVAFNPDLMLAQNEYLIALQSGGGALQSMQNSLVKAARMRLQVLGMSETQIIDLGKKGKAPMNLLLPQRGESVWVYASIYEMDVPWVKVGMPVKVFLTGSSDPLDATIESMDPMLDPMTRTLQVRFRLLNPSGLLKPEMFVKVIIEASGGSTLTIPENAVLDSGMRKIAFVQTGEGKFEPRNLKLGKMGSGMVEVVTGVQAGEKVVTNANFLLDSESKLKAAISGMEGH